MIRYIVIVVLFFVCLEQESRRADVEGQLERCQTPAAKQPRRDELPETTPPLRRGVHVTRRDLSKRASIGVIVGAAPAERPFGFARALEDAEDLEIAEQFSRAGRI